MEDELERAVLEALIAKLDNTRYRELRSFLKHLHDYCQKFNKRELCATLLKEPIEPGE